MPVVAPADEDTKSGFCVLRALIYSNRLCRTGLADEFKTWVTGSTAEKLLHRCIQEVSLCFCGRAEPSVFQAEAPHQGRLMMADEAGAWMNHAVVIKLLEAIHGQAPHHPGCAVRLPAWPGSEARILLNTLEYHSS